MVQASIIVIISGSQGTLEVPHCKNQNLFSKQ